MLASWRADAPDPVVMGRLIANSLLAELRASNGHQAQRISVINVLRLLDMYESGSFDARAPLGILEKDDVSDLNRPGGSQRLRAALELAHSDFSPEASAGDFVRKGRMLLDRYVSGTEVGGPNDFAETVRFLSSLTKSLAKA